MVAERMVNEGRLSYVVIIKISKQNKAIFGMQVREKTNAEKILETDIVQSKSTESLKLFLCGVENK